MLCLVACVRPDVIHVEKERPDALSSSPSFAPLLARREDLVAEVFRVDRLRSLQTLHADDTTCSPYYCQCKLLLPERLRLRTRLGLVRSVPALAALVLKLDGSFIQCQNVANISAFRLPQDGQHPSSDLYSLCTHLPCQLIGDVDGCAIAQPRLLQMMANGFPCQARSPHYLLSAFPGRTPERIQNGGANSLANFDRPGPSVLDTETSGDPLFSPSLQGPRAGDLYRWKQGVQTFHRLQSGAGSYPLCKEEALQKRAGFPSRFPFAPFSIARRR